MSAMRALRCATLSTCSAAPPRTAHLFQPQVYCFTDAYARIPMYTEMHLIFGHTRQTRVSTHAAKRVVQHKHMASTLIHTHTGDAYAQAHASTLIHTHTHRNNHTTTRCMHRSVLKQKDTNITTSTLQDFFLSISRDAVHFYPPPELVDCQIYKRLMRNETQVANSSQRTHRLQKSHGARELRQTLRHVLCSTATLRRAHQLLSDPAAGGCVVHTPFAVLLGFLVIQKLRHAVTPHSAVKAIYTFTWTVSSFQFHVLCSNGEPIVQFVVHGQQVCQMKVGERPRQIRNCLQKP